MKIMTTTKTHMKVAQCNDWLIGGERLGVIGV